MQRLTDPNRDRGDEKDEGGSWPPSSQAARFVLTGRTVGRRTLSVVVPTLYEELVHEIHRACPLESTETVALAGQDFIVVHA